MKWEMFWIGSRNGTVGMRKGNKSFMTFDLKQRNMYKIYIIRSSYFFCSLEGDHPVMNQELHVVEAKNPVHDHQHLIILYLLQLLL